MDYIKFYNLENYLLKDVGSKFRKNGFLDAVDFFCIVIWKANRAKSKIAKKILRISKAQNLDKAVKLLTKNIYKEKDYKEKLKILLKNWEFGLPMASAILSILYPNIYSVYDYRVCAVLNNYQDLYYKKPTEKQINGYFDFVNSVKKISHAKNLRDKDKELWGKSFYEDLKKDIKNNFKK